MSSGNGSLPSSRPKTRFLDIAENAEAILEYTADMDRDSFAKDRRTRDATERCLSRISEAAVKLGAQAETMLPIIYGEEWHYRRRARLGARYVPKKNGAMVGFREKRSSYITDMRECHVLPPQVSALISPLRALVEALSVRARLPQIEVAVGDNATALVLAGLVSALVLPAVAAALLDEPMADADEEKLPETARAS